MITFIFAHHASSESLRATDVLTQDEEIRLSETRLHASVVSAETQLSLIRAAIDGNGPRREAEIVESWRAKLIELSDELDTVDGQSDTWNRSVAVLQDLLTRENSVQPVYDNYLDEKLMVAQFQAALVTEARHMGDDGVVPVADAIALELYELGVASSIAELALPDAQGNLTDEEIDLTRVLYAGSLQLINTSPIGVEDVSIGTLLSEVELYDESLAVRIKEFLDSPERRRFNSAARSAAVVVGLSEETPSSSPFRSRSEVISAASALIEVEADIGTAEIEAVSAIVDDRLAGLNQSATRSRWMAGVAGLFGIGSVAIPFLGYRRNEQHFRHKALTDSLTGLLNREGLNTTVLGLTPTPEAPVGLLHIDLDRFKPVNDTYGHQIGDLVLVEVAERLKVLSDVGAAGQAWAARAGGDEFIMVTQSLDEAELRSLASRVIARLEHFEFDDVSLRVGASIGIAACSEKTDPKDLILEADLALYQAKRNGRGQSATYERTTGEFIRNVRRSIDDKKLQVAYHPQVDLVTGKVIGSEALARIRSASGEIIPANRWIQIIDWMSGSEQLLEAVVASINNDVTTGARFPGRIWLNISPHDLARHRGTHKIITQLAKTGLPPQRLGIELSESEKIENPKELAHSIEALAAAGIAVALDNFGVRNMPLGYLVQLPVQRVKLDRAMLTANPDRVAPARRVTSAIVSMANDLGIEVVAGGVESAAEIQTLRELQIGIAQGYLFGQPLEWDPRAAPMARESDRGPGHSLEISSLA